MTEADREICRANQDRFDGALSRWLKDGNDTDWKIMFTCTYFACNNIAKRLVKGLINNEGKPIQVQDLDGKACDACMNVLKSIVKNRYEKLVLSSFCYLFTYGEIFGVKQQRIDKSVDYDLFSNTAYYSGYVNEEDDNNNDLSFFICKESYSTNYSIGEEYND